MKRILIMFLIICIASGCSEDKVVEKESKENLDSVLENMKFEQKKFECPIEFSNIKFMTRKNMDNESFLLTDNNVLYEYDFDKKFSSSNKNCDVVDTNGIVITHFSNSNLYPTNENEIVYYSINDFNNKDYNDLTSISKEKSIKERFPNSTFQFYHLPSMEVYTIENKAFFVENDTVEEFKINNEEKITYINWIYSSNITDDLFLETKNNYYECKLTEINKDSCYDYKDKNCHKTYVCEESIFNSYKNEIIFFNGNILITKDNKVYQRS